MQQKKYAVRKKKLIKKFINEAFMLSIRLRTGECIIKKKIQNTHEQVYKHKNIKTRVTF